MIITMGPGETFGALIAGVTILGYVFFTAKHRERMSMIDKGVDASIFSSGRTPINFTLKLGMLAVGIALGILAGEFLHKVLRMESGVAFTSMMFLCGGLSLIVNYFIERKE